jgi:predicted nuclease with TOPRIM domain
MAVSGNVRIGQRLLDLKERLDSEKSKRSELQGELNSVKKQLTKELSVETLEEAEAQLEEHRDRLISTEADIVKKLQSAEDAFEMVGEK